MPRRGDGRGDIIGKIDISVEFIVFGSLRLIVTVSMPFKFIPGAGVGGADILKVIKKTDVNVGSMVFRVAKMNSGTFDTV